ncbi:MAG: cell division protein FtsL [Aeromonadales bacterium]|nr:cell division protein FtsL [Aeromonadales bacterium]
MQQSNALRKVEENYPSVVPSTPAAVPADNEPKFGQRPNPKARPVQKTVPMVTQIVEERIIRLQTPEEKEEEKFASATPQPLLSLYHAGIETEKRKALVPTIFNDILSNFMTYGLILVLTTLAVYKVHQVQMTRDMTVQYNEVAKHNDQLHKQWLSLLSEREALTEYSIIRQNAQELGMVQPKTEDEVVVDLR